MFCLIVDTNNLRWFTDTSEEISQIVIGLLKKQRGKMYIGGDLTREYPPSLRPWLAEGIRAGWIVNVPDGEVDQEIAFLLDHHVLKSNDSHVVALARVSGARVLVSCDGDLRDDFRDHSLISQPPGKLLPFKADKRRVRKFLQQRRLCTRKAETLTWRDTFSNGIRTLGCSRLGSDRSG